VAEAHRWQDQTNVQLLQMENGTRQHQYDEKDAATSQTATMSM